MQTRTCRAVVVSLVIGAGVCAAGAADDYAALVRESGVRGGLVVQIGVEDAASLAAMRLADCYTVHGVATEASAVEKVRAALREKGVYGKVAVDRWDGARLPYTDNLVNLVIASDDKAMGEIRRVLAPGGVACVKTGGKWVRTVKARPGDIDEWTHLMYKPDNNVVSKDMQVGPPYHMQWVGDPRWTRSHDHLASLSVAVSGGGRLFYIVDMGPIASVSYPSRWMMFGRDAFNGVQLWERPMGRWEDHLHWGFRNGPPELGRRIVVVGDKLYVTMGYDEPVSVLDAATGKTLRQLPGTAGTREILYEDGKLYLVTSRPGGKVIGGADRRRGTDIPLCEMRILVLEAASGKVLWEKADADTAMLAPVTLALSDGRIFYQNAAEVICLEAAGGKFVWRTPRSSPARWGQAFCPTLVVKDGVVLSADHPAPVDVPRALDRERIKERFFAGERTQPDGHNELLLAFSAKDGKLLWEAPCQENFLAPVDVVVAGGRVWVGDFWSVLSRGFTAIRDLQSGKIVQNRTRDDPDSICVSHHRCHRYRATEKYILLSRAGIEFVDTKTGEMVMNHWVRGTCEFGILPANGLVYAPPHSCACYFEAKLNGFNALAAKRPDAASRLQPAEKPETGPAFGVTPADTGNAAAGEGDWPTFRRDNARSGCLQAEIDPASALLWQKRLPGRLSAPVAAGGTVLVASVDTHTVYAIKGVDGSVLWARTVGGPVDSPPTIHAGTALFGSTDGYVYCVRMTDGELVWRFRAAPEDRRVMSYGHLESAWPVSGSILVQDGSAYFVAGRAGYLDGGLFLYRLKAATGELVARKQLDTRDPKTGYQPKGAIIGFGMPGVLPDILSASDGLIYMRHKAYDASLAEQTPKPHLFTVTGFLDGDWWHRAYWIYGTRMENGFRDWAAAGQAVPNGGILSLDKNVVYGFGRDNIGQHGAHVGLGLSRFRLFSADKTVAASKETLMGTRPVIRWSQSVPIIGRAMALTGTTLLVAGPPDSADATAGLEGRTKARLMGVSTDKGEKRMELELTSSPVFDGLAVAGGRLYLSLMDGSLVCVGVPNAPAAP